MPSSLGSWEDSIQLINAPQVPCVVQGTEEMAGGVVVEQGSKEFKQMIWTRHWPCLGTSVSLLRPSQIPCLHKMAYGKVLWEEGQKLIHLLRSHFLLVLF